MKLLRVLKETFLSSLPLAVVMVVVCCFVAPFSDPFDYVKLSVGYAGVVVGQSLFLVGLDVSILPIGRIMGESLIKLKKLVFIIFFGVLFGLLATVAEPALSVLAAQTNIIIPAVNKTLFLWIMGMGIGIFVGFALFRIVKNINIKIIFGAFYVLLFIIVFFVPEEFVALAFDGSGATTGDISVPFILALGLGVSTTMSKRKTDEETFGIVGLASVGPILVLFIYGIILKQITPGGFTVGSYDPGSAGLGDIILENLGGVALALLPIIVVFLPFQIFLIKMSKKSFRKILIGTIPVYAGLLIFLSAVDFGFAFAGSHIGKAFLDTSRPDWFKWLLLIVGFVLGAAITLSEPAVTVLGEQLEEITDGHIKKMTIRLTLAIGIGFAAVLAVIKIITQVNILWFLIPLYSIALVMMLFSSKLFVGLAFDSGGVSGGALSSAFLTPLTLGIAQAVADSVTAAGGVAQSVLVNGFGIIAFISVTPLIAVQTLGLIYKANQKKAQKAIDDKELGDLRELEEFDDLKQFEEFDSIQQICETSEIESVAAVQPVCAAEGEFGEIFTAEEDLATEQCLAANNNNASSESNNKINSSKGNGNNNSANGRNNNKKAAANKKDKTNNNKSKKTPEN